ncbi:MAG: ABC transporter permease, partial [Caldilineaceae bacterium]|nr:ABC transporter permease [Caldilineaceae bacterium]
AVALGLALLIFVNGMIAGIINDGLQNTIRLQTGHVQVRRDTYEEQKVSLQWDELLDNADELAAQALALPQVKAAAPVLWATGVLNTADDSAGLRLYGIDTESALYTPIQESLVAGSYLAADDRDGILIGRRLADSLGITAGQRVNISVVNADGQPDEALFTVRGVFFTGVPTYDENSLFMPLSKAQALTRTDGHASALVVLLNQQKDADAVAAALQSPGNVGLTWEDLNRTLLDTMQTAMAFYVIIDAIVILVVAVIIANTLLMAVFERIREMGILAALGMKRGQIMSMFVLEAAILGLVGVAIGIGLGSALVAYFGVNGIDIGDVGAATQGIAISTSMRTQFVPDTFAWLSVATLVIILLASLYPAWFAARMEPVDALHSR